MKHLFFFSILLLAPLTALAHGGEDHTPPATGAVSSTAEAASSTGGELTLEAYSGAYEILLRYPPPKLGSPGPFKIFISDWATNVPSSASAFSLEFPSEKSPPSVSVIRKISEGIYEGTATFSAEHEYSALLKFSAGGERVAVALAPIYTGQLALSKLPKTPTLIAPQATGAPIWLVVTVGVIVLIAAWAFQKRRKRLLMLPEHSVTKK